MWKAINRQAGKKIQNSKSLQFVPSLGVDFTVNFKLWAISNFAHKGTGRITSAHFPIELVQTPTSSCPTLLGNSVFDPTLGH